MTTLGPQAATLANVNSSASSVTIFADTGHASGRAVFNDSSAILYLAFDGRSPRRRTTRHRSLQGRTSRSAAGPRWQGHGHLGVGERCRAHHGLVT